jgi:hypothetical protein
MKVENIGRSRTDNDFDAKTDNSDQAVNGSANELQEHVDALPISAANTHNTEHLPTSQNTATIQPVEHKGHWALPDDLHVLVDLIWRRYSPEQIVEIAQMLRPHP